MTLRLLLTISFYSGASVLFYLLVAIRCQAAVNQIVPVHPTVDTITSEIFITDTMHLGREHFVIQTPSACYYLDKAGGGFSRMIDREGIDWIQFKMEPWGEYPASAASAYRGIPNFVHGSAESGAGHPGHDQCMSSVVNSNTIMVTSLSQLWQWRWTFYPDYAIVQMLKTDPDHPYWFLYEGVPGGKFDPPNQYFGSDKGGPISTIFDYYHGDKYFDSFRWAYFGHRQIDRVLYVVQDAEDQLSDTFSYLGNSEMGIRSQDGMVVFGFGRAEGAKPLIKIRHSFRIGFLEGKITSKADHEVVAQKLNSL